MTKSEFKREAAKAGLPGELYGVTLNGTFFASDCYFRITGGKVTEIEWRDEWVSREEYSYWMGTHKVTSLGKVPYVVLTKNRRRYLVEASRVRAYVDQKFQEWLTEKAKEKVL